MFYDIEPFEQLVNEGFLRKCESGDLVLYGYTDKCTYERHWNDHTRIARGLILNKHTGEVVALPFSKFFNLGEMEESFLTHLPNLPYTVSEKMDGSLGIIYHYNNQWNIATRGSFNSNQAIRGQEILKKYNIEGISPNITVLVEIIYPENKIVIDYQNAEKLVLLGAFNRYSGYEVEDCHLETMAYIMGMELAPRYSYTIEEMIELQKTLPKEKEGFVVRFDNGFRVKIKGDEYMRIHKILSHMSPLSLWEVMKNGYVDIQYLQQLPEELRKDFEPMVASLEDKYTVIANEVNLDFLSLPTKETTPEARKEIGLFLKANPLKHSSAMFPCLLNQMDVVDKYIMKQIRPDGNIL